MDTYLTFAFYFLASTSVLALLASLFGFNIDPSKTKELGEKARTSGGVITLVVVGIILLLAVVVIAFACLPATYILVYRALVNTIGLPAYLYWIACGVQALATIVGLFRNATTKRDAKNEKPANIPSALTILVLITINYIGLYGFPQ